VGGRPGVRWVGLLGFSLRLGRTPGAGSDGRRAGAATDVEDGAGRGCRGGWDAELQRRGRGAGCGAAEARPGRRMRGCRGEAGGGGGMPRQR
jgi:hypothetical protein